MSRWRYLERQGDDAIVLRYPEDGEEDQRVEFFRGAASLLEKAGLEPDDLFEIDDDGGIIVSTITPVTDLEPRASFGDGDLKAFRAKLRLLASEYNRRDDNGGGD